MRRITLLSLCLLAALLSSGCAHQRPPFGLGVDFAVVLDLSQQVAGMAEAEGAVGAAVVLLDEMIDCGRFDFEAERFGLRLHEHAELHFRGVADLDFVRDAAEEGFVEQVLRLEVRREDEQLVERHLDLPAAREVEEVIMLLKRHDKAVEDVGAADALAAEVVDDERAAIGFELHRGFGNSGGGIEACFEVIEREFAADDDRGTTDEDPAAIVF